MVIAAASVTAAVGLMVAVGSASAGSPPVGDPSNPTFPPAQKLCQGQGGVFGFAGPGGFYYCQKPSGSSEFSKGQLNAARGLCEGGYGAFNTLLYPGAFGSGPNYICQFGAF